MINQGTLDAVNIQVADFLPASTSLSTSDTNGWTGGPSGTVTNTILSIPAGTSATLNIVLTIDPAFTGGPIINNAEITADNGDDIDSTPGNNSQPNDFADDNDPNETDGGDDEDPETIQVIIPEMCDELVCNGDLQISLNVTCMLELTPDQLLEAPLPGIYTIQLFDEHGDFLRDSFLLAEDAGKLLLIKSVVEEIHVGER